MNAYNIGDIFTLPTYHGKYEIIAIDSILCKNNTREIYYRLKNNINGCILVNIPESELKNEQHSQKTK